MELILHRRPWQRYAELTHMVRNLLAALSQSYWLLCSSVRQHLLTPVTWGPCCYSYKAWTFSDYFDCILLTLDSRLYWTKLHHCHHDFIQLTFAQVHHSCDSCRLQSVFPCLTLNTHGLVPSDVFWLLSQVFCDDRDSDYLLITVICCLLKVSLNSHDACHFCHSPGLCATVIWLWQGAATRDSVEKRGLLNNNPLHSPNTLDGADPWPQQWLQTNSSWFHKPWTFAPLHDYRGADIYAYALAYAECVLAWHFWFKKLQ